MAGDNSVETMVVADRVRLDSHETRLGDLRTNLNSLRADFDALNATLTRLLS